MTHLPMVWRDSLQDISRRVTDFDQCPPRLAGLARGLDDEEASDRDEMARDELHGDEFDAVVAAEALIELEELEDDDPLPEYGDFWIDTDDIDAT